MSLLPNPEVEAAWQMAEDLIKANREKPIHAKPSLYAYYFQYLKEIAERYGYNLVLHGSLNRDLDLIAIPWQAEIKPHEDMLTEMVGYMGGKLLDNIPNRNAEGKIISLDNKKTAPHGRLQYVINLNRGGYDKDRNYTEDPQYYIDISIIPH